MSGAIRVYVEVGGKRAFASAADWPGWSRGAKDEKSALEALAAYAPRYAKVAKLAHVDPPKDAASFTVIERLNGNASTDFGVPGMPAKNESKKLTAAETKRLVALVEACWKYLDQVKARSPQELRKGPRGGGRDRDKMYAHLLEAEVAYAKQLGVSIKDPEQGLAADVLDGCDVLIWWGHARHSEISNAKAKEIVRRIKAGNLSLIALHSAHWSEPFVEAMRERAMDDAQKAVPKGTQIEYITPPRFGAPKADAALTPKTPKRARAPAPAAAALPAATPIAIIAAVDELREARTYSNDAPPGRTN